MKTYCCGKDADKERLARKWARINNCKTPPTERARTIAQAYIQEIEELPLPISTASGDLILMWNMGRYQIYLTISSNDSFYDSLTFNGQSYQPVTIEKVKELIYANKGSN